MGKVNRFMKPQDRNVTDTYVSQYVPLPFKAMKARTEDMDRNDKENQKASSDLINSLDLDVNEVDRPYVNSFSEQVNDGVNSLVDNNNGNYYGLNSEVNKLSQFTQRELNYGKTKTALTNRKIQNESQKRISEGNMSSRDKSSGLQYQQDRYEAEGGAVNGAKYRDLQDYKDIDLRKDSLDGIKALHSSGVSNADLYEDKERGWIVTGHQDKDGVHKEVIRSALKTIKTSEDFNSLVDYKFEIADFYDKMKKDKNGNWVEKDVSERRYKGSDADNRKKFGDDFFNHMFTSDWEEAYAWTDEENRINAKEMKTDGVFAKIKADPAMNLNSYANSHVPVQNTELDNNNLYAKSETPTDLIHAKNFETTSNFLGVGAKVNVEADLYKEFTVKGHAPNENQFKKIVNDFAVVSGFFLPDSNDIDMNFKMISTNGYMQEKIMKAISQGKFPEGEFDALSPDQKRNLQNRAIQNLDLITKNKFIIKSEINNLFTQGKMKSDDFKAIESFNDGVNIAQSNNNLAQVTNGMTKAQKQAVVKFNASVLNSVRQLDEDYSASSVDDIIAQVQLLEKQMVDDDLTQSVLDLTFSNLRHGEKLVQGDKTGLYAKLKDVRNNASNFQTEFMKHKKTVDTSIKNKAMAKSNFALGMKHTGRFMVNKMNAKGEVVRIGGKAVKMDLLGDVNDKSEDRGLRAILADSRNAVLSNKAVIFSAGEAGKAGITSSKESIKTEIAKIVDNELANAEGAMSVEQKANKRVQLIKEREDEFFSTLSLSNELDSNGNYQVIGLGTFALSLSNETVNVNIDKYMPPSVKEDFRYNSYLKKSKTYTANKYPIAGFENKKSRSSLFVDSSGKNNYFSVRYSDGENEADKFAQFDFNQGKKVLIALKKSGQTNEEITSRLIELAKSGKLTAFINNESSKVSNSSADEMFGED